MPPPQDDERVKVVIVGAGASGLQCAQQLLLEGYDPSDILLLEAKNRVGGRIHSVPRQRVRTTDQSNTNELVNFTLDLGAAWVHGTAVDWNVDYTSSTHPPAIPMPNPMMELLQKSTPPDQSVYQYHLNHICSGNPWTRPSLVHAQNEMALFVGGKRLENDDPVIRSALTRHTEILRAVSRHGNHLYDCGRGMETVTTSLGDAIEAMEDPRKEVDEVSRFYQHMLECWYGSSAAKLQLCEFTKDNHENLLNGGYTEAGDFYGPHCTLRHGMQAVLGPLLEHGVQERIRLNQQVSKITFQSDSGTVLVGTEQGLKIKAECCVVTMSAGCLKHAVCRSETLFSPELCPKKVDAVNHLSMGIYKKVFLTFDHIFWPEKPAFVGMIRSAESERNPLGNYLLLDNLWARHGIPCIEAVLFGQSGEWATHKPAEEIQDAVLSFMKEALGLEFDPTSCCKECEVTRWEEDPFTRGAFSCVSLGALARHFDELRRPEWQGRLIFCGEVTIAEMEGSVHAALLSGKNAAEQARKVQ